MRLSDIKKELAVAANPERARGSARFFKAAEGQYGHGDRFIGLTVPILRKIAHRYTHLSLPDVEKLLASPIHEHRFAALEILVAQYEHALIHKAVGWMLREAGKQSAPALLRFLKQHDEALPRTTLRYAIERFPAPQRKRLLAG